MRFQPVASFISTVSDEIVIAIRPEHASRLYSGEKIFELRRVIPKVVPRRVYLYETNGDKKISGHIIIERVIATSPEALWDMVGEKGTTRERFFAYFANAVVAYAFEVSCVVKYETSIKLEELRKVEPGFRPPQNFLYLQNLPRLRNFLWDVGFTSALTGSDEDIILCPFRNGSLDDFTNMVVKHIDGSYRETGKKYAEKLVQIHDSRTDLEGVMTRGKIVYEILFRQTRIGFMVLTMKNGGSVKTGPVLLLDDYIAKGFGKRLRQLLHAFLLKAGYRKVYCTVPTTNTRATGYLISSGYKLEAHLTRHYHEHHDEFVFGYTLSRYRAPGREYIRQIAPVVQMAKLDKPTAEVVAFIEEEFTANYSPVTADWAIAQVREALAYSCGTGSDFRPREIYIATGLQLLIVALCLYKRGGSVKILLLTRTSHQRTLSDFINFIGDSVGAKDRNKVRKLYSHVPIGDYDLLQSFYACGYRAEGVMERPYSDDTDFIALGKVADA